MPFDQHSSSIPYVEKRNTIQIQNDEYLHRKIVVNLRMGICKKLDTPLVGFRRRKQTRAK
jgi:hypothetical protein